MDASKIRELSKSDTLENVYLIGAPCFGVFDPYTSLSDLEDQLPKQLYRYNTVCICAYAFRQHVPTTNRVEYQIGQSRAISVRGYVWDQLRLNCFFAQGFLKWHKPPNIPFCLWKSRKSGHRQGPKNTTPGLQVKVMSHYCSPVDPQKDWILWHVQCLYPLMNFLMVKHSLLGW